MDEFLIHHVGMTHPPLWMTWVVIIWVFPRPVIVFLWCFYSRRKMWRDWGKPLK